MTGLSGQPTTGPFMPVLCGRFVAQSDDAGSGPHVPDVRTHARTYTGTLGGGSTDRSLCLLRGSRDRGPVRHAVGLEHATRRDGAEHVNRSADEA